MLRNLGIRWKILAVLALPVLVLVVAVAVISGQALSDAKSARHVRDFAGVGDDFSILVKALQEERLTSYEAIEGSEKAQEKLKSVREKTDGSIATLDMLINAAGVDYLSPRARQVLDRAEKGRETLATLRRQVDGGTIAPNDLVKGYSDVITLEIELPRVVGESFSDREQGVELSSFSLLLGAAEAVMHEQIIGIEAISAGKITTQQQRDMAVAVEQQTTAINTFQAQALTVEGAGSRGEEAVEAQALRDRLIADRAEVANLEKYRKVFTEAGPGTKIKISSRSWRAATSTRATALTGFGEARSMHAVMAADSTAKSRQRGAMLTIALAAGLLLLSLILALILARWIAAPLRHLTVVASMLRNELPNMVTKISSWHDKGDLEVPQIEIESNDEVGRLAAAFNDVNATTVEVARQQAALRASIAEMFVNVARRTQVLLSRQLAFIDQLERTEENPDTLDNLFRLDHLATRMRRNAESLLVLGGVDGGRRMRNPMPLSDVVRTAISEIEHFERVNVTVDVDPPVVAHMALSAAHLIAELVENATVFSDPGSQVTVGIVVEGSWIRVSITDDGLGMTEEELAEANIRVNEATEEAVMRSQRLGFFVVGRLASKLEARVSLNQASPRGTVVHVDFPASIFVPGSVSDLPGFEDSGASFAPPPVEVSAQAMGLPVLGAPQVMQPLGAPERSEDDGQAAASASEIGTYQPTEVSSFQRPAGESTTPPPFPRSTVPPPFQGIQPPAASEPLPMQRRSSGSAPIGRSGLPRRGGADEEPADAPPVFQQPASAEETDDPYAESDAPGLASTRPDRVEVAPGHAETIEVAPVEPEFVQVEQAEPETVEVEWTGGDASDGYGAQDTATVAEPWQAPAQDAPAQEVPGPEATAVQEAEPEAPSLPTRTGPTTGITSSSLFSGFRSRREVRREEAAQAAEPQPEPVEQAWPVEPQVEPEQPAWQQQAEPEPVEQAWPVEPQAEPEQPAWQQQAEPEPVEQAWPVEPQAEQEPVEQVWSVEQPAETPDATAGWDTEQAWTSGQDWSTGPAEPSWSAEPGPVTEDAFGAQDWQQDSQAPVSAAEAEPTAWDATPVAEPEAPVAEPASGWVIDTPAEPVADQAPSTYPEHTLPVTPPVAEPTTEYPASSGPVFESEPVQDFEPVRSFELEPEPTAPQGYALEPEASPAAQPEAEAPVAEAPQEPEPAPVADQEQDAPSGEFQTWSAETHLDSGRGRHAVEEPEPEPEPVAEEAAPDVPMMPGAPPTMNVLPTRSHRSGFRFGRRARPQTPPPPPAQHPVQHPSRHAAPPPVAEPMIPAQRGPDQAPDTRPAPVEHRGEDVHARAGGWSTGPAQEQARQEPVPAAVTFSPDVEQRRSALASEALTELSRLSSYRPASVDSDKPTPLVRRTRTAPAAQSQQEEAPAVPPRARTAAAVRSMLTGFQAGVARGRTSPTAMRPMQGPAGHSQPSPEHES